MSSNVEGTRGSSGTQIQPLRNQINEKFGSERDQNNPSVSIHKGDYYKSGGAFPSGRVLPVETTGTNGYNVRHEDSSFVLNSVHHRRFV